MGHPIHAPERQAGESMQAYRLRRAASKAAVRSMCAVGKSGGQTSREKQRDDKRKAGTLRGVFGLGLIAASARARADDMARQHRRDASGHTKLRDEHGAYTCVGPMFYAPGAADDARHHDCFNGFVRHKWLAGISAQRGY